MDGKTRVCGVIANPVEHSLSPLLQNLYAERTGVNLAYVPFKVKEEQLEEAVKGNFHAVINHPAFEDRIPHGTKPSVKIIRAMFIDRCPPGIRCVKFCDGM